MPPLESVGRYNGLIKEHGVTTSSKQGLPQFVATLLVTQVYNDVTEEWEDWTEHGLTITAFAVLATLSEQGIPTRCFKYDEVMEATGWKGVTYADLAAMDLKDHPIQFMTQDDTFTDKNGIVITKLKVVHIAAMGATLGLKKLSSAELGDLDAKFSIPGNKPAATAVKPKAGKKAAPKPAEAETKAAPPPVKPPARKKPPVKAEPAEEVETCTEEEAFNAVHAYNAAMSEPVPDEIRDDYWTSAVDENSTNPDNVTPQEWPGIRDKTIEKLDIPF